MTQLLQQRDSELGYLLSCLNCSPHDLPIHQDTVTYILNWPFDPAIIAVPKPPPPGTTIVPVLP